MQNGSNHKMLQNVSAFGAARSKHACKRVLHMITQRVDIQTLPLATTAGDRSPITAVANSNTENQTLVCCYWERGTPENNRYTKGIWLSVLLSVPIILSTSLFRKLIHQVYSKLRVFISKHINRWIPKPITIDPSFSHTSRDLAAEIY